MARNKHFTKSVGKYYFSIKMGHNNTILISRQTEEEAKYAYGNYVNQKKEIEWLGKWDGKKFTETDLKAAS